jgi:iron complex outermembrane receptor protein
MPEKAHSAVEVKNTVLEFRQFEKVEITGSSIVRKEQTQALPVQVLTRDDIKRSGLKNVPEVIANLPMMANYVEAGQAAMISGGYANAAIHGMPTGTLVLVNGLRMAPYGRQTMVGPERSSVDLNTLPLADIERIELLTDGASSLYGTDAIAGVVNIILRTERKGFEITVDQSLPHQNKGQGTYTSLGWGTGNLMRDGYSVLVSAELSKQEQLLGQDRAYASQGRYVVTENARQYTVQGNYQSIFTGPAMLYSPSSNSAGDSLFANSLYQNGQCQGSSIRYLNHPACLANNFAGFSIYPQEETRRLRLRGDWLLPAGQSVFAEALLGTYSAVSSDHLWPDTFSSSSQTPGTSIYRQALAAAAEGVRP